MESALAILLVYGGAFSTCTIATSIVYFVAPLLKMLPIIYTCFSLNSLFSHQLLNALILPNSTNAVNADVHGIVFEKNVQLALKLLDANLVMYTCFCIGAVKRLNIPQGDKFSFLLVFSLNGTLWVVAGFTALLMYYFVY